MKFSKYNIILECQESRMLFNTLSLNMVPMNSAMEQHLKRNDFSAIPDEQLSLLKEGSFIVEDSIEEINYIENRFDSEKEEPIMTIKFLLSTMCNSDCLYCYQHYAHYEGAIINEENIRLFFAWVDRYIEENKIEKFVLELFGGEPLFAAKHLPLFFSLLNDLKEHRKCSKLSTSIITNTSLFTPEILSLLVKNDVEFKFSLDGPQPIHDSRRPLKMGISSYAKTIDTILKIKEMGRLDLVSIRYNLDKNNIEYLEDVAHLMRELGVQHLYCGKIFFRGKETPYSPNIIDELNFYKDGTCVRLYNILSRYGYSDAPCAVDLFEVCQFYRRHSYVISPKLEVAKCDELLDSKDQQIGFINNDAQLVLVGENYKLQTDHSPIKDMECKECAYLPLCGMGCPVKAMNETGSPLNHTCINKEIVHQKINILLETLN